MKGMAITDLISNEQAAKDLWPKLDLHEAMEQAMDILDLKRNDFELRAGQYEHPSIETILKVKDITYKKLEGWEKPEFID